MTQTEAPNSVFWHLTYPDSTRGLAEGGASEYEPSITCPLDRGHQRAGRRIGDLNVALTSTRMADFVWTWLSDCLLPERTLALFRAAGLTGFEVRPVTVRWKVRPRQPDPEDTNPGVVGSVVTQMPVPRLWELVVTGCGGAAPPASGVRVIESCPTCDYEKYSDFTDPERLIDEHQWDGSDFFQVWPFGYKFVTDRVAQLIRANGLRGANLEPLSWLR